MQIRIPTLEEKKFVKPSVGEIFGNLWSTKNIDFDRSKGKIRLAERMWRVTDSGDDADMEVPVAFIRTNADQTERWWALVQANATSASDGLLFKTGSTDPDTAYTQDAIASSPTDCYDDMEIFGTVTANGYDRLVVARDTDLAMMNNGTWDASWWDTTLAQAALTANPHPLHQFLNLLLIADGNVLHTIDDSLVVVASRITLPKEYQIIWIADDGLRVYMGTKHKRNGTALVFPWDGTSEKYDEPIPVGHSISLAGATTSEGILHIMNGAGQLMAYNGQAFDEVAHLPIFENPNVWSVELNSRETVVHHNGMGIVNGKIHIVVNAGLVSTAYILENCLSGVWVYDKEIGLYNKYSLGAYDGATSDDWGAGIIAVTGAIKETDKANGRFLVGASVYTDDATTQLKGIFSSKSTAHKGYIITAEIQSSEFQTLWKRLKLAFKKLENSTDQITVKYMVVKDSGLSWENVQRNFAITWSDTDTFTTTNANFSSAAVGDEVEILCGKGAGSLVHISAIALVAGTYTVDTDEAITGVSGDANIRVQKWKKLGAITSQTITKKLFTITKRSKWIKVKIELRGTQTSPEIEEILLEFNQSKR